MTVHLSSAMLDLLADGELSADQLVDLNEHLANCSSCTSNALLRKALRSATARAGRRYLPPSGLHDRIARMVEDENKGLAVLQIPWKTMALPAARPVTRSFATFGWIAALALFMIAGSLVVVRRDSLQRVPVSSTSAALVTEVCDEHIAALAAGAQLEVVSSDRHTVKPWFQGRLPFTFNLPEDLPPGMTLNGANLAYLSNRPVAQLLYSIGPHRVSVFLWQRGTIPSEGALSKEHSGFHLAGFTGDELEAVAVSDVDATRLVELVGHIERVQTHGIIINH